MTLAIASLLTHTSGVQTKLCEAVIGREEDLDTARTALERALQGAGSLLCVLGEAGVGKSRGGDPRRAAS